MISPHIAAIGAALIVLAAADASAVAAQSGLEGVERLTRLGRTEEAREALLDWWDDDRGDASRRELQRGLWLRGRLTVDPVQAELDFRRLAVLYPSGQFTPDAIFRLAQSSYAMGDEDEARGYVATLARDYPRSEAREDAEAWLENAGPLPPPGDTPTQMRAEPTPDPEASDASADLRADEPPADDPPADDPPLDTEVADEEPAAASDEPSMNYYVQLGAFGEEERAMALYEEVRAQDIDVRVVHVEGSRFTHVRVGRFAERAAAVDLLEELTEQGINAALVRDDRPERPIGE
jgi:cell division septation protein DedD